MYNITARSTQWSTALITLILLANCTVTLVAPYDPVTDEKTAELQEKILLQFNEWERKIAGGSDVLYSDNEEFYSSVVVTLDILIARNEGIEKNRIVTQQLQLTKENIGLLEELHRNFDDGKLTKDDIGQVKGSISSQLNAIQKFQMKLKNNEKTE